MFLRHWIVVALLSVISVAHADSVVLIQGYLSDGDYWNTSGITKKLETAGWSNGGYLTHTNSLTNHQPHSTRRFYTLSLPTQAPLLEQESALDKFIFHLRDKYKEENIILIGHSAGGVVARLYMVKHPHSNVIGLISIASPHLGTELADMSTQILEGQMSWAASVFGLSGLTQTPGLFHDLSAADPNNILRWLNYQEHPTARYISVVRTNGEQDFLFDFIVPEWSQDMNNVCALRGKCETYRIPGMHFLQPQDGDLLVRILESFYQA